MRIKDENARINYKKTASFFDRRADKYNEQNPYSVTMYQDKHPELVEARNNKEIETLLPLLMLDEGSKVLDIACGIGRWSDAIKCNIEHYCGIDFCPGLIDVAKKRNSKLVNRSFYVSSSVDVTKCLTSNSEKLFNRVLIIGGLVYLNDEDVINTLNNIKDNLEKDAIICIREPIGLYGRLTLKEQFSEELNDEYNAIYRTRDELVEFFNKTLVNEGFVIDREDYLFKEDALNNRKETSQYYFILNRKK